MVDIKLKDGQSGYDVVGEYIRRYWKRNVDETVVVSMEISHDGSTFEIRNEVALPLGFNDIEFLYDWWEGERYIKLFGIKAVSEFDISGGIYEEE